ncbi:MAG: histidine phosphatase family protein [Actinomycetales bacterium]|nr:histidine phosphatase family protein [Actinomycetales bacterium]
MAGTGRDRRLVLLRHAKSAWPHGVPDHERPLTGKGRRNAKATGRWFAQEGPTPDLVLCSDAVRAQHTWEIVAAALPAQPRVRVEPELYGARADDVLALVRALPTEVRTVVVVGHEPTMSSTTLTLAGKGSVPAALRRVREKYPTTGVAVLRFRGPWSGLERGGTALEVFAVPRA